MKNAFYCIALALICGLLHGIWIMSSADVSAMTILTDYSLGRFEITATGLVELTISFFPFILFQIVEGVNVFKYFCVAGIYVFSRCKKRNVWFLREAAKMLLTAFSYSIVWFGSGLLIAQIRGELAVEPDFWCIFIYQIVIMTLWLFFITLLINLLAIWFGSYPGTCAGIVLQLLCVGILLLWDENGILSLRPDADGLLTHIFLLKCNPVAHLFLAWHSVANPELNAYLEVYQIDLQLYESVIYMGALVLLALIAGCILIRRVDFISEYRKH